MVVELFTWKQFFEEKNENYLSRNLEKRLGKFLCQMNCGRGSDYLAQTC